MTVGQDKKTWVIMQHKGIVTVADKCEMYMAKLAHSKKRISVFDFL